MISRFVLILAFLISLCVPTLANAEDGTPFTMISLLYGEVSLSQTYWAPVDKQTMIGMMIDYNPGNWPVNFLGWASSSSKSAGGMVYYPRFGNAYTTVDAKITELSIGARKYLMDTGMVRPYVSAGLSSISAELSASAGGGSVSDNTSSIGYFGNGGVFFLIDRFSVGLDLKILTGTSIKLYGVSGDANYNRWSIIGGISF